VVLLDPISDYADTESRFSLAFQLRKLAINLPIY